MTIPPTVGRRITLTFVSVPGKGRPGLGALELEAVRSEQDGDVLPPPPGAPAETHRTPQEARA